MNMEIQHNDYNSFASVYIRGTKEVISKLLTYAAQLNDEELKAKQKQEKEKGN